MECLVERFVHGWWPTDPDLLDLVGVELFKLLQDEFLIPSPWVLAFLRESDMEVEVLQSMSVAVVSQGFEEFECN